MPVQSNTRVFERLIPSLTMLRDEALRLEQGFAEELAQIEPVYRASARNPLNYLGVRRHDIRNPQRDLASLGLSSLGVLEATELSGESDIAGSGLADAVHRARGGSGRGSPNHASRQPIARSGATGR